MMTKSGVVRYYNMSQTYEEPSKSGSRRFFPPSREKIRKMARKSSEGGRGFCHFCNWGFSQTFLRWTKVDQFEEDFVCLDCMEEKNLRSLR